MDCFKKQGAPSRRLNCYLSMCLRCLCCAAVQKPMVEYLRTMWSRRHDDKDE